MSWLTQYYDLFAAGPPLQPEIAALRERFLNALILIFGAVGSFSILVGAVLAFRAGQVSYAAVYLGLCAVLSIGAALARRLPYGAKAGLILAVGMGMGIMTLFRIGLSGVGVEILMTFAALAGVLLSARRGLVLLAVSLAAVAAAGVTHVTQIVQVPTETMLTSHNAIAWVNAGIIFTILTLALILSPQLLLRRLQVALNTQQEETAQLQRANAVLTDEVQRREQAERAHLKSEIRFGELVAMLPETVFEADIDGRLTWVNRAGFETFGYDEKDLEAGINATDMLHPDDHRRALKNIEALTTGDDIGVREYRGRRRDGVNFPILIRSVIRREAGEPVGIRGFIIDISDKKRFEGQIQQAQRMEAIGTLAGGIAHDFNNLLMGIQGRVSLMRLKGQEVTGARRHLEHIEQCVQSAADLTNQLLGVARGGKYESRPTDINRLIERSIKLFGRTHKDISIDIELVPDLWSCEVDRHQIEQVLLNLLLNAWQAIAGGGRVEVRSQNITLDPAELAERDLEGGDFVMLSVRDDGEGIPAENLARIFEPFFTTKDKDRGSGLGLASAYGIIHNHGGAIVAESVVGHGATFRVYLPAGGPDAAESEPKQVADLPMGSETVLLVDDEAQILEVTGTMLERLGYTVLRARGGVEALAIFRDERSRIDLVMLDMVMPDMTGAETFYHLRALEPELRILLSSGYSVRSSAAELMADGCNGFIQKPFALEPLAYKVREVLDP